VSTSCKMRVKCRIYNHSYGEKGSVVIQNALLYMFALDPRTLHSIKPLSLPLFIQHILVPHVAMLLIASDLQCSPSIAFGVMRDSREYGYQHFVVEDGDSEFDGVLHKCQQLVKQEASLFSPSIDGSSAK
jgi:hypothetical protein